MTVVIVLIVAILVLSFCEGKKDNKSNEENPLDKNNDGWF